MKRFAIIILFFVSHISHHTRLYPINAFNLSPSTLGIFIDTTSIDVVPDSHIGTDAIITTIRQHKTMLNTSPSNNYYLQIQNENDLRGFPLNLANTSHGLYLPWTNISSSAVNDGRNLGLQIIWTLDSKSTCFDNLDLLMDNDIICICGDAPFATWAARTRVPSKGKWIWYPTAMEGQRRVGRYIPPVVEVWRLRSSSMMGVVLPWDLLQSFDHAERIALFHRMKRPCSAVDYPPIIYLVGEDEEGV